MAMGRENLRHVLESLERGNSCFDPDCELHHPDVIEDDDERRTALAWALTGWSAALRAPDSPNFRALAEKEARDE